MEPNANPWKANLTNGLILGLVGVVYSLATYFFDLTLNKSVGYIFLVFEIVVLYFLVKSYRDNYKHGMLSYGEALGAGLIICLYYAIIMAIFTYILYAIIDKGLIDKQIALSEELLEKKGMPQSAIDAGMAMQRKIMRPGIIAPLSIFGNMFFGLIISLIIGAFVRKEGNPLEEKTTDQ